jgi:hypothetical protein
MIRSRTPQKGIYDVTHWFIWNIPATAKELPEGVPAGADLPDGSHQLKRGNPPAAGYSRTEPSLHVRALRVGYEARLGAGCNARRCHEGDGRPHSWRRSLHRPVPSVTCLSQAATTRSVTLGFSYHLDPSAFCASASASHPRRNVSGGMLDM